MCGLRICFDYTATFFFLFVPHDEYSLNMAPHLLLRLSKTEIGRAHCIHHIQFHGNLFVYFLLFFVVILALVSWYLQFLILKEKKIYMRTNQLRCCKGFMYIWIWCRWQNCLHINLIHKRRFSCFFLSFSLKKMSQDTRSWCDEFFLIKIGIDFLRVSCLIKWFYFIFLMVNKNTNNSYFNWWPILLKSVRRHLALKNINQWQCVSLPPHGDDRLNRRGKNFYQIKF